MLGDKDRFPIRGKAIDHIRGLALQGGDEFRSHKSDTKVILPGQQGIFRNIPFIPVNLSALRSGKLRDNLPVGLLRILSGGDRAADH